MHPHLPKLKSLLSGLSQNLSLKPKVVIIKTTSNSADFADWDEDWVSWENFVGVGKSSKIGPTPHGEIEWKRQNFGKFTDFLSSMTLI